MEAAGSECIWFISNWRLLAAAWLTGDEAIMCLKGLNANQIVWISICSIVYHMF